MIDLQTAFIYLIQSLLITAVFLLMHVISQSVKTVLMMKMIQWKVRKLINSVTCQYIYIYIVNGPSSV